MKKTATKNLFVGALIAMIVFVNQACSVAGGAVELSLNDPPYENIDDFNKRGVSTDGFSATTFQVKESAIEISCFTHGKPEDKKLIEPSIAKLDHMTKKLQGQYKVTIKYYDGNPNMTIDDKPVGTGEIVRTAMFPK